MTYSLFLSTWRGSTAQVTSGVTQVFFFLLFVSIIACIYWSSAAKSTFAVLQEDCIRFVLSAQSQTCDTISKIASNLMVCSRGWQSQVQGQILTSLFLSKQTNGTKASQLMLYPWLLLFTPSLFTYILRLGLISPRLALNSICSQRLSRGHDPSLLSPSQYWGQEYTTMPDSLVISFYSCSICEALRDVAVICAPAPGVRHITPYVS